MNMIWMLKIIFLLILLSVITLYNINTLNTQWNDITNIKNRMTQLDEAIEQQQLIFNNLFQNSTSTSDCFYDFIHFHTFCSNKRMPQQILGTFSVVEDNIISI